MDLFGRIEGFLEAAGPLGILAGMVVLGVLALLAFLNNRQVLVGLYLASLMFSGFVVGWVDTGSTLVRWLILVVLAVTAAQGWRMPGLGAMMIGLFALYQLSTVLFSPVKFWGAQKAALMLIAAVPMGAAITHSLAGREDVKRLLKMFLLAAGLYAVMGLLTLPSLRVGSRFAGATSSAPLFVLTGGLLLPVAVWGALQEGLTRRWRSYSGVVALCVGVLCLFSGQRTGTLAGFVGCVPLVLRLTGRRVAATALLLLASGSVLLLVFHAMPEQGDYVYDRFTSMDTSGREERWEAAREACMRSPFIGHGEGADQILPFGFHNAFLVTWYNGGIVGLVLFAGAFVAMAVQGVLAVLGARWTGDTELGDLGRLVLGWTLAAIAAGFFESKLVSPSNIAIFTAIVTSAILTRLRDFRLSAAAHGPGRTGEAWPAELLAPAERELPWALDSGEGGAAPVYTWRPTAARPRGRSSAEEA